MRARGCFTQSHGAKNLTNAKIRWTAFYSFEEFAMAERLRKQCGMLASEMNAGIGRRRRRRRWLMAAGVAVIAAAGAVVSWAALGGRWSLDILESGGRRENERMSGDLGEVGGKSRFVEVLTEEAKEIGNRRAWGGTSPLRQRDEVIRSRGTELEERGEMEKAVTRDSEGGDRGHRQVSEKLSVTDTEKRLELAMIDFDLPTVEIGLQE